ncbi:carbohydrate-binding protein [Alteromonas aestuariivivens]|nr:carbohydrate-binding protein [Alteromonas aestuariivivens]
MRKSLCTLLALASFIAAANQPPEITLKSPASNAVIGRGGNLHITALASDPDGSVVRVDFYVNDQWVGSDDSNPYSASVTGLPEGSASVRLVATDNLGATSEVSTAASTPRVGELNVPGDLYFYNPAPYDSLLLYWRDTNVNEIGYQIEQRFEDSDWVVLATTAADTENFEVNAYDRTQTREFRIRATNINRESEYSNVVRIVGSEDNLEVYPEVPGIRTPKTLTVNGITFSELQDQTPSDPSLGKATRLSTFFRAEVRLEQGTTPLLNTPVYETRPQLRNYLGHDDPAHTGGHHPYGYANYGPNSDKPERTLHNKHWTNIDANQDVVVRVTLLESASLPGNINLADLEIQPAPLDVIQVDERTVDITLPGAPEFARHYRVAMNRNAWSDRIPRGNGSEDTVIESPLFIFINPVHLAPASAPENEIVEFDNGSLVAFGSGIHLPNPHYQFFGPGENQSARELYVPGDAYLHYGFLMKNDDYAIRLWGRGIYSDEMFDIYRNVTQYEWSTPTRTPWADMTAIEGNVWGITQSWDTHAWLRGKYQAEPTTIEGLTNIGARMGVMFLDGNGALINHKDVGYGGGTYQSGVNSKTYYNGCLLINDDDITYVHHDYLMENSTTYVMHNGPSFQIGWGAFNSPNINTHVRNHTVLSSDRRELNYGKNHGVFDSRLNVEQLKNHSGGLFEDFEFWGKETIIFQIRIWNENAATPDTTSILGDMTFKNFTIRERSYNPEILYADSNYGLNKQAYLRFLHFDNLVIEGYPVSHIDDGNYFDYNEGALLHTITFFSLPDAVANPEAGNAPMGQSVTVMSEINGLHLQQDTSLPASFGPITANTTEALDGFTVVDAGNGYVALKSSNGYYLKADPARYGYLYTLPDTSRGDADTTEITENAKFVWVDVGEDSFALYSKAMGLYVRAEQNTGPNAPLYAASDSVGAAETFTVTGTIELETPDEPTTIRVEAEDYSDQFGLTVKPDNIEGIKDGEWAEYQLNAQATHEMTFAISAAAAGTGGTIEVYADNILVGSVDISNTGGWNNYSEFTTTLNIDNLDIGTLRLEFVSPGTGFLFNIDWFELTLIPDEPATDPLIKVEAEDFTEQFGLTIKPSTIEGIKNGEWASYLVDFETGSEVTLRVSASAAGQGGRINVLADGTLVGTVNVSNTGGWGTYQTFETTLDIPFQTVSELRLEFDSDHTGFLFNIDWFELNITAEREPEFISLLVEAEHLISQQGVAVKDTTVESIKGGDWAEYLLNIQPRYDISVNVNASAAGLGGTINFIAGGVLIGSVDITNTGGWSQYQTFSAVLSFPPEQIETLQLEFVAQHTGFLFNIDWFELQFIGIPSA